MTGPTALDELETKETGFARLHFGRDIVLKRRKPVRLFLGEKPVDLDALESRRAACLEEARVDDRLAPGVVMSVVPVTRGADGRLWAGGEGSAVDWALQMRRLPERDRGDRRLEEGRLDDDALGAVAFQMAAFHERARGEARHGPDHTLAELARLIDLRVEAKDGVPSTPLPDEVERIEAWQREFLARSASLLAARADGDAIRRGHGELDLEHVFVDDAGDVRILAGLEIAPPLREVDVTADVALLATDLAVHRRADFAERFVAEYARLANDFDLYPLLDFHSSLRATIRAKLDWYCADREVAGSPGELRYRARARRLLALAQAAPRRPLLPPIVVAMGGQVASGKSTVARHIARRIGAPVVGTDPTRDFLLGARLNEDLHEARWEESFEPGFGERVYAEALRRASAVLESGRPVVIDGCFRSREQRRRAKSLAERYGRPFLFVEAQVPRDVQHGRLVERAERDDVPVDDWQSIADRLRAQWESAEDLPEGEHLAVDTAQPLEQNTDGIEARLPTWPERLTD